MTRRRREKPTVEIPRETIAEVAQSYQQQWSERRRREQQEGQS